MSVSQFPAHRRLMEVRRCAQRLQELHGEAANQFWRAEMALFVAAMKATGAQEEEIRAQAALFLSAVQGELEAAFEAEQGVAG